MTSRTGRTLAAFVAALICLARNQSAGAHDFTVLDVLVVFKSDGTYWIDLTVDVDALALGVPPSVDSTLLVQKLRTFTPQQVERAAQQAGETITRRLRLRFDGVEQSFDVVFPQYPADVVGNEQNPSFFGILARLSGVVPEGAQAFTFGASRAFNAVHLTILNQKWAAGSQYLLAAGEDCPPYPLMQADAGAGTLSGSVARYLVLGIEHIIPKGLDHILFVTGLFLLSTRWKPLLWQITAFTVAHSLTLALSIYDVVALPSRLVESLIALSIAYVAFENVVTAEMKPWRPAVVFGFGLLHGLGFAGVLRELGLPQGEFVSALVLFNVGVELGQLTVVAAAFLLVGWFRRARWYRRRVVIPASVAIGVVGLYWVAERAWPAGPGDLSAMGNVNAVARWTTTLSG